MPEIALSISLNLSQKLQDKAYRQKFFWAESSARIAAQLIALRKRRGLNQKQVAQITGTKQPAISRAEQADYQNWNLNTLRSIADALDARLRVIIEPSEDILREYDGDPDSDEFTRQVAGQRNNLSGNVVSGPLYTDAADLILHSASGRAVAVFNFTQTKHPTVGGFGMPFGSRFGGRSQIFETNETLSTSLTPTNIAQPSPDAEIAQLRQLLAEKDRQMALLLSKSSQGAALSPDTALPTLQPQSQTIGLRNAAAGDTL